MFKIEVSGDLAGVITLPKQITYASAVTTTDVVKRAQKVVIRELPRVFVIRGNWINPNMRYGIKIKFANTKTLEASIYTAADWLLEAHGYKDGVKKPDRHKGHLSVPDTEHTRHGIRNPVARNEKARTLLNRSSRTKAFKMRTKSGVELIMQRVGLDSFGNKLQNKKGQYLAGRGKKKKSELVVKHMLIDQTKVPYKPVITRNTIIQSKLHFGSLFRQNLTKAIKNAKLSSKDG